MKASTYYPPRATAFTRFLATCDRFLNKFNTSHRGRSSQGPSESLHLIALALLAPGLPWLKNGKKRTALIVIFGWLICLSSALMCLPLDQANTLFIFASSIHAISITAAIQPSLINSSRSYRILFSTSISLLIVLLVYNFLLFGSLQRIALRINLGDGTFLIMPVTSPPERSWKRGEWVSYNSVDQFHSIGRILALPGEAIEFRQSSFSVNGKSYQRFDKNLPTRGRYIMEPGQYFIWSNTLEFPADDPVLGQFILSLSTVQEENLTGRLYHRWFWQKFNLPALTSLSDSPTVDPTE